jgi:predicted transcriptional regulator
MAKAGAPPKFKEAHVNWVFWKIAQNQPMGRKMLVEHTGLGEGSLRTILDRLEEYGLVDSNKAGRSLTDNGAKVINKLKQMVRIEGIGQMAMTNKPYNCFVLVKRGAKAVKSGMEQRDAAIKAGRSGATTLVVQKGKLMMPGFGKDLNMEKDYPQDSDRLKRIMDPEEGDVVVIGSEDKPYRAEEAAWVAASTLLK